MIDTVALHIKKKGSIYIIYWILYVVFFTIMQPGAVYDYRISFYIELISLPPKIIFVMLVMKYLMEELLFKNKTKLFVIYYIPILLLFAFIQRLIDIYIYAVYFVPPVPNEHLFSIGPSLYSIIKLQFVATIPFSINLFNHWAQEQKRAHAIKEEKSQAELNFLRNQFHPHFIFNALNSLYSKILNKSDESADIVLKISSLLRFSIYDVNTKKISLEKEVSYLQDYIALQQIRFDKNLDLSFTIDGITANKMIEPFLMMPFIENSFKHCVGESSPSGWITISISVIDDWLTLKIENSKPTVAIPYTGNGAEVNSNGIGLTNVKRRLQILYPESHTLKVTDGEESYFVLLKFKLDTNDN